tara:strand:- start:1697 stop:2317 length:621 start_codon:yes stop_codon:yes gene_type:complete
MALKSYTRLKDFIQNNALGNAPWDQGRFNAVDLMDSTLMLEDLTRQQTLKGTYLIEGSGIVGAQETALIALSSADGTGSNKGTFALPKHAVVDDYGMVFQTALTGATSCVITANFGTSDGGAELATGIVVNSGASVTLGAVASATLGSKAVATGAVIAPVDGAAHYSVAARTVHFDAVVSGAAIGGLLNIVYGYVKYHVNYELIIA